MASEKQHVVSADPIPPIGVEKLAQSALAMNHTIHDQRDMKRMGKEQEFLRSFRIFTSIAFTSCVMGTWEVLLITNTSALVAGGLAGLWWQFIWCYVGQAFVVLSLSEMASMAPTAGGQYHWVSEFASPRWQKILSYTSGWFSTLAWQAFVTVDTYSCAFLIQAMIILNNPDYVAERWHTTLLMIAIVLLIGAFNIFCARWLAICEGVFAIMHYIAWIPLVAVLWGMTKVKQSPEVVFTQFTDNGGNWGNIGLTVCIGQVGAMFTISASDAAAHMAEEVREAGVVVPRSIWWAFVMNIPPTMIVLATYIFCIGDFDTTVSSVDYYPVVSVFLQSTGSIGGATGLTFLLFLLLVIISASTMASTVRQTFAFARDNGMLFSPTLARVSQPFSFTTPIPLHSIYFTMLFSIVLSLINIGSTTAFNAFLSVSVVALMATYTLSIACIFVKRLQGHRLPLARWRLFGKNAEIGQPGGKKGDGDAGGGGLGKWGIWVNGAAMVYSIWSFFWSFWPISNHPTLETFNWAVVIFVGVMLIAALAFIVQARKTYDGPVSKVRELEDEDRDNSQQGS